MQAKSSRTAMVLCMVVGALTLQGYAAPVLAQAQTQAQTQTQASPAGSYPDKPVRMVVPQAPGSATDTLARFLQPDLARQLGQPVVIDNRPGGALVIGLENVARSPADGYSIAFAPVGGLAISPNMVAKLPYDVLRDFQPLGLVARGHMLLAASPSLPVRNVLELIDYAKKNPGKLMNASSGNGTGAHLAMVALSRAAGIEVVHVPYRGGGPAMTDLLAGNVSMAFASVAAASAHVQSGRLRALGAAGPREIPALPGMRPIAEQGFPGFDWDEWNGLWTTAGAPRGA
jgi:tripartite-type tricarboxylate transporter receptor subunit TctC